MRFLKILGARLMSMSFFRTTTELHVRAVLLDRFTRLDTPMAQRVA